MTNSNVIVKLCDRIRKLESYLERDALCPCCDELEQCNDECTFEKDSYLNHCYDRYHRMIEVRNLLSEVRESLNENDE